MTLEATFDATQDTLAKSPERDRRWRVDEIEAATGRKVGGKPVSEVFGPAADTNEDSILADAA